MGRSEDTRRQDILEAAYVQFRRYGFRRTSMEDIARGTDVSRASLYSHFENKEEIFRQISVGLQERALAEAEGFLCSEECLEVRVAGALAARLIRLNEIGNESAHGSEICDETSRLSGDVVSAATSRFHQMLVEAFDKAALVGDVDLERAGLSSETVAELLRFGAFGLIHGAPDRETFQQRIRSFVQIFFAGLG